MGHLTYSFWIRCNYSCLANRVARKLQKILVNLCIFGVWTLTLFFSGTLPVLFFAIRSFMCDRGFSPGFLWISYFYVNVNQLKGRTFLLVGTTPDLDFFPP